MLVNSDSKTHIHSEIDGDLAQPAKERDEALSVIGTPSNQELRRLLEQAGCRFSSQRAAVLAFLLTSERHPTAEEVYHAVREQWSRISLATVYKSLESLTHAGLATRLVGDDGAARYDGRGEQHYHLRDVSSGEVRDLPVPFDPGLLEKLSPGLLEKLEQAGFAASGYRLEVLGRFTR